MKQILSILLTVVFVLTMLAACGKAPVPETAPSGGFDPSLLKTMGDVFSYAGEGQGQEGFSEKYYVTVFSVDGIYYRAVAELPQDVSDAIWAIDFFDEDRDQKIQELVSPLAIRSLEDLSAQIPDQAALDAYKGKTGGDLFEQGWTYWYYNLDDMEAGMYSGPFSYSVQFEYNGEPLENDDDFDFYEEFKDLKILSVTFDGLGDATMIEEDG